MNPGNISKTASCSEFALDDSFLAEESSGSSLRFHSKSKKRNSELNGKAKLSKRVPREDSDEVALSYAKQQRNLLDDEDLFSETEGDMRISPLQERKRKKRKEKLARSASRTKNVPDKPVRR